MALAAALLASGSADPQHLAARSPTRAAGQAATLLGMLRAGHYNGNLELSQDVARQVKRAFLTALDAQGLWLYQSDYDELFAIDLDLNRLARLGTAAGRLAFVDRSIERFRARLDEGPDVIADATDAPFDFATDAELRLPGAQRSWLSFITGGPSEFPVDRNERVGRWRNLFQYRVLQQVFFGDTPADVANFKSLLATSEPEARAKIKRQEIDRIRNLLNRRNPGEELEDVLVGVFLNVLTTRFDPHSGYFSEAEKNRFEASLATRALSFGVVLERTLGGETRVARLVPGGPAWKTGKINAGDRVLTIRFPEQSRDNKNRAADEINTADLDPAELSEILDGGAQRKAVLTVRKPDGLTLQVTLYKQKLSVEDNIVSSFILNGPRKIGYIYLPAFYVEWENPGAPGCASDVAREIIKLKRENIDGLIIDLRNNGGGSLREATDLAGIFVDQGPLFLQRERDGTIHTLKDLNRGAVYQGPLVVMVNGQSASASEFFAAAMRDYNRAVIVGARTFGKASSQIIVPVPGQTGFLKLTTNLYYGLRGESHQLRGVEPDVVLPDAGNLIPHETDLPYALPAATIQKDLQYNPVPPWDKRGVQKNSDRRVGAHPGFERIKKLSDELEDVVDAQASSIPLNAEKYFKQSREFLRLYDAYQQSLHTASTRFAVNTHESDGDLEKLDTYLKERNTERKKQILEDIYIDEAYQIAADTIAQYPR